MQALGVITIVLAGAFLAPLVAVYFTNESAVPSRTNQSKPAVVFVQNAENVSFPVIDIGVFMSQNNNAERKQAVSNALAQAAKQHGFFYITGTPLGDQGRDSIFGAARQFFNLPAEEKSKNPIQSGGFTRGYVGIGGESGSHRFEVKEAWSYGYNWDETKTPSNPLTGPNVWPSSNSLPSTWRPALEQFYNTMVDVAEGVVRALSMSLGLPEQELSQYTTQGAEISLMRMFHYFPYSRADGMINAKPERIGSSPHTDWGFLTLIVQENQPGLELYTDINQLDDRAEEADRGRGRWVSIPIVKDSVLINIGDYLSMLTNGEFKSPLHRVVAHDEERYSMVFFYYPSYDSRIAPIKPSANGERIQGYSVLANQQQEDQLQKAEKSNDDDITSIESKLTSDGEKTATNLQTQSFGEHIVAKWRQVFRKGTEYANQAEIPRDLRVS